MLMLVMLTAFFEFSNDTCLYSWLDSLDSDRDDRAAVSVVMLIKETARARVLNSVPGFGMWLCKFIV